MNSESEKKIGQMLDAGFCGLGEIQEEAPNEKYIQASRKRMGAVAFFVARKSLGNLTLRGEDPETQDAAVPGLDEPRVCAASLKMKYGDRQRGLQILRAMGAGGRHAQNRTDLAGGSPGKAFDLNAALFGDSADSAGVVYPVKAAALYQDALSILPYSDCVASRFGILSAEEGTLWDVENKKNSNNLRTDHFVRPGVTLIQTVIFSGKSFPREGVKHFLASLAGAGASGGRTSANGVNVDTRLLGACALPIMLPSFSSYNLLARLAKGKSMEDLESMNGNFSMLEREIESLVRADARLSAGEAGEACLAWASANDLEEAQREVMGRIFSMDPELVAEYGEIAKTYEAFFDAIFVDSSKSKKKAK